MAIQRFKDVVESDISSSRMSSWRKSPSQATHVGTWFDLSMSPGNPNPKYWFDATPLISVQVKQSTDGGLFHGDNVSPSSKYLRKMMIMTSVASGLPMVMILCDYLLYYPTIDESITDPQVLTNSATLPRYTTGEGVQVIAISTAGRTGGQSFTISYTNSSGVSGRTSVPVTENTNSVVGSIVTSDRRATSGTLNGVHFIPLQNTDTGVRSIESITMGGADVGLFTLILVKPLAQLSLRGIDAPVEIDYLKDFGSLPQIQDDAYLNFLCCPSGSLQATNLFGTMELNIKS